MTSTPANERSRASTLSTPQSQPPTNLGKEDATDWLAIDKVLAHIQSVTPSDPYVLTIPQDVEPRFHHRDPQQAQQWRAHTPFQKDDHEALQYSTWHFHEPGGMYVQHSTRREDPSSRIGTPKVASGGVKKTMSLGAYKKKVAGGTPGPEEKKKAEVNSETESAKERKSEGEKSVKKPAVKGPVERIKADEEVLAAVEDGDEIVPPTPEKKKDEGKKELKRKREDEKDEDVKEIKREREDSKTSEHREEKQPDDAKPRRDASTEESAQEPAKRKELSTTDTAQSAPPDSYVEQPAAKKAKIADPIDKPAPSQNEQKIPNHAPQNQERPKFSDKRLSPPTKPSAEDGDIALPPRLSPLREESKKDKDDDMSLLLPPRLSPTLPANITASLAAREQYGSKSKSSAAGDNLSPPRKALENSITKRKSPVNGFRANSSSPMVRSDAEDVKGRSKTSAPRVRSPSPSGSEIAVGKTTTVSKKESEEKLVVKLKFKQRSTRESLRQLLRLPAAKKKPESKVSPKPSPTTLKATDARHREQRDTNARGVAQKVGPATKGVARKVEGSATSTPTPSEKRPREEKSEVEARVAKRKNADILVYEPPAKRKKPPPESPDVKKTSPVTPSQPTQRPPTPASSVKKPAAQPTPSATAPHKKPGNELLAAATTSAGLKREPSHDSQAQAPTPSASSSSPAAFSTSQAQASAVPKSTPTTASTPASTQPKTARQQQWEAQHKKFDKLGRELKRAVSADLSAATEAAKTSSPSEAENLRRLAAIKAIESLLAYILAFTSADEALLAAEPRQPLHTSLWRTLTNYFPFVKHGAEPFPALQGLACALAVVFCARIVELCVGVGEKRGGNHEEVWAQAWVVLQRAAGEAEAKLDVGTLGTVFPRAWKEGVEGVVPAGEERLEPGKFAGAFRLPLGVQTKPVRAVRAAHAMLGEWMEREGMLGYEMRVKLE